MRKANQITGCLLGSAIGDALAYSRDIQQLTEVTENTQILCFQISAILNHRLAKRLLIPSNLSEQLFKGYKDWAHCKIPYTNNHDHYTWLYNMELMHDDNLTDHHFLSTILTTNELNYTNAPINNCKDGASLINTASLALGLNKLNDVIEETIKITNLTHGHPLEIMGAVFYNCLLYTLCNNLNISLKNAINDCLVIINELFSAKYPEDYLILDIKLHQAINIAQQDLDDTLALMKFTSGNFVEDILAITLYCSLKYLKQPKNAIITAVNHLGYNDLSASLTGQIMGCLIGNHQLAKLFQLENLKIKDIVLELGNDLVFDFTKLNLESFMGQEYLAKYANFSFVLPTELDILTTK